MEQNREAVEKMAREAPNLAATQKIKLLLEVAKGDDLKFIEGFIQTIEELLTGL